MKKILIRSPGSRKKLEYVEVDDLVPKDDEVLIQVHATGVNYADVCVRFGVYESAKKYVGWPICPGFEVSGTVAGVGPNVSKYKVGDLVIGFTLFNAYATQVCIREKHVIPLPKEFSLDEGAGFVAVFFTAFHALHQHIKLRPGDLVLIHSAAGGVGTALVQLSRVLGLKTVAVIGASHKKAYIESFQPDYIIDKSTQNLWAEAEKIAPKGYRAIFDANGYTTMNDSYKHLAPTGKLIVYGAHGMFSKVTGRINYLKAAIGLLKTPRFSPLEMTTNNKGVIGFNLSFLFQEEDLIDEGMYALSKMVALGQIRPVPVTKIPFDRVADAHQLIESGNSVGKIVLTI